ncbi:MAG: DinB family protein [Vicinamibacterales bacterium]
MLPAPLQSLLDQVAACEADARSLVDGLTDEEVNWQVAPGKTWSIAQCLDHLRATNEFYLQRFLPLAEQARDGGPGPFSGLEPSGIGRWFLRTLEPPVRMRAGAPKAVVPASTASRATLVPNLVASHDPYRRLVAAAAFVDANRVVGPNPFFPVFRMRLSTVLGVIPAHDRRHLWQARIVREAIDRRAAGARPSP